MRERVKSLLVWIAGGALLVAVAVDTLAMIGRQIRIPLLGSIEIVEAVVLIAAAGALIVATVGGAHARVNLVFDRLPPGFRRAVRGFHAIAACLLFAVLLAGTVWIAADLWAGHEESELLHIPYKPLRIVAALSLGSLVWLAVLDIFGRGRK